MLVQCPFKCLNNYDDINWLFLFGMFGEVCIRSTMASSFFLQIV